MDGKIFYLTKEKLHELKREYEELLALEHGKVMGGEAPKILESEDINPEFISYHEDIDSLRLRIGELSDILEHYELIKNPPKEKQELVGLGAKVKIETNGQRSEFVIVGTLEANPTVGKISNESPIGKALLGHRVGDEVSVFSPAKKIYTIKHIKYETN